MVTAGAASAITVATAAAMTKGDPKKIAQLPDTTGLPFEVIQQGRSGYEAQIRVAGARIVTVETREELDRAISERTAMMFFLNYAEPKVRIKRDEWVRVARERGVVSFNDAAADVPPREHLSQYVREGFDLVAFSGGKGLRGPQCSGLLLGRKDLIEGARTLVAPHGGIGRGMKVGKEEIVGLVAAVERYMTVDLEAERRVLEAKVDHLKDVVGKVKGVAVETNVPEIANHVPHFVASWDETALGLTAKQVHERLQAGRPADPRAPHRAGEAHRLGLDDAGRRAPRRRPAPAGDPRRGRGVTSGGERQSSWPRARSDRLLTPTAPQDQNPRGPRPRIDLRAAWRAAGGRRFRPRRGPRLPRRAPPRGGPR